MLRRFKNLAHFLLAGTALLAYGFPAKKLTVIGVTGTDGKTTTSTLIYHILKSAGFRVALISTVAAYIGEEEIDTGFHVTSPDPFSLQALLKKIVSKGFTHVVLEVTSHGLDQSRVLGTNAKWVVFTNITHEHLDYHKTYANYVAAKAKLLRHAEVAVLNLEDPSFEKLKPYLKPATRVLPYNSKDIELFPTVSDKFAEKYNRFNAVAAIKLTQTLGVDPEIAGNAIKTFPGVKGRMEEIKNNRGIRVIVDFAHTPNALKEALTALKTTTTGKLIAVYGAAGLRDYTKRPMMGEIGAKLADEVILTAEDPRTEKVATIIRQMKEGVTLNHGHVHAIEDRAEAISFAINKLAHVGDTVGIFGKGHEKSLNLNGKEEIPWSDQEAAKIALQKKES